MGSCWRALLCVCLVAVAVRAVTAAPFVPSDDAHVLERLPVDGSVGLRELRGLRAELAEHPQDLALALRFAQRCIETGRALADPRYFGHAEAALASWWALPRPPAQVLLLRATLKQNRHDFSAALDDLELALQMEPRMAQAWLTRAVILQVQGRYDQAHASCLPLLRLGETLLGSLCLGSVMSVNGQARAAYALLGAALEQSAGAGTEERLWALTALAEAAMRLGEFDAAASHLNSALAVSPTNVYALSAYADLLLDQQRWQQVIELLKVHARNDTLLLRLTIAERRAGTPDWTRHLEDLRARFAAAQLRGERLHQGEEARFHLLLLDQPATALDLATSNWALQREPRDARILLEAALASRDRAAARSALALTTAIAGQDVQLSRLTAQLRTMTR
jgi:tetratricopeptide (TPR) repeat protein